MGRRVSQGVRLLVKVSNAAFELFVHSNGSIRRLVFRLRSKGYHLASNTFGANTKSGNLPSLLDLPSFHGNHSGGAGIGDRENEIFIVGHG